MTERARACCARRRMWRRRGWNCRRSRWYWRSTCLLHILGARGRTGEIVFYPVIENHHRGGILRLSLAPAPNLTAGVQQAAEEAGRKALEELGYAGVLCIEFFELDGRLLANEMAPRVHNSGHWSIEG